MLASRFVKTIFSNPHPERISASSWPPPTNTGWLMPTAHTLTKCLITRNKQDLSFRLGLAFAWLTSIFMALFLYSLLIGRAEEQNGGGESVWAPRIPLPRSKSPSDPRSFAPPCISFRTQYVRPHPWRPSLSGASKPIRLLQPSPVSRL